ncbi:helix-turn-helix domain-containing protein [Membranihabitans maritimus]|uniref:helix-turn-helix domain-containing protein n=1 Tax=Membranihabitans maritimus TaxID=2904244 RepID=UPI001F2C0EDF|nr:helix-turn-helix domain-containing protein [Membranihabitans maritimus]
MEFTIPTGETIRDIVREEIEQALIKNAEQTKKQKEYLTRKQTAAKLHITLPTLHQYTKEGLINNKRIGRRVLYSMDEVEKALTALER